MQATRSPGIRHHQAGRGRLREPACVISGKTTVAPVQPEQVVHFSSHKAHDYIGLRGLSKKLSTSLKYSLTISSSTATCAKHPQPVPPPFHHSSVHCEPVCPYTTPICTAQATGRGLHKPPTLVKVMGGGRSRAASERMTYTSMQYAVDRVGRATTSTAVRTQGVHSSREMAVANSAVASEDSVSCALQACPKSYGQLAGIIYS